MSLLPDYSRQAERYDETRSASSSILRHLRQALRGAPGSRLADIGGGTGNYALALRQEGWEPVVVDRSPAMISRAAAKGLETVRADAQDLPFDEESFDAATMVSMLHHVEDRGAALGEARRILNPTGRLALLAFTREDAATLWILDYFPSSRVWMEQTHPPRVEILGELPGAQLAPFRLWTCRTHRWRRYQLTLSARRNAPIRATSGGCNATTPTSCERAWPSYARRSRQDAPPGAPGPPRSSAGQSRSGHRARP